MTDKEQSSELEPPQVNVLSDQPPAMSPNPNSVADALERRLREQRERQLQEEREKAYVAFDENHEKRQELRRMLDPGILRPNPRPLALESLQTLITIAENIIQHPDEEKYQKFKPTNAKINRLLMEPQGTIEYARAMGFNPEVENFQPFYVFNKRRMTDLTIGAELLKETLERELAKEGRTERAKREEKAVAAAHLANIKQAFLDDRKSRNVVDRRERELREARAANAARRASQPEVSPTSSSSIKPRPMPGSGHTLSGEVVPENTKATDDDDDEDDEE